jgi:hypothetical protein
MTAPPMARLDICLNFVTGYVHTKGLVVELNLKKIWWNYFKVSFTPGWSKLRDLARRLAENLYERPVFGPRCGPTLCDACFQDVVLHRPGGDAPVEGRAADSGGQGGRATPWSPNSYLLLIASACNLLKATHRRPLD